MQIHGLPLELSFSRIVTPTVGEIFGVTAGEFLKVDKNGRFVKGYIRVQIRINPEVPVVPGVFLKLYRQDRSIWVEFRYKRVFKLCYMCRRIGHIKENCDLKLEEAKRRMDERVEETGQGKGCEYLVDPGRPMYSKRVRVHKGKGNRSNRMIIFDEEDGMLAIEEDFDYDQDPPLTVYVMRRKVQGEGGGERVVFEQMDSEEIGPPVRESRMYWRHVRNSSA
ncbi:hypothetical protein LOK49_LG08G02706 [Camellia lanceoleosa]|uniref:Uncharacterized protein n=2 Tax=Camellia lanceoleosa TaxID=1840588 RepID=A0ACC0GQG5_9ERIC|nr:hypothetical protein LOK49_LG08G02734 [Camellia lanceoleosa]KAI8004891.1 hypothetical protein LOK49_LG08G02706 [Camellia lanceoleosa]